jgi:hypothetical protein
MAIDRFQVLRKSSNVVVYSEHLYLYPRGKNRSVQGHFRQLEFHVHLSKLYEITLGNDTKKHVYR